MRQNTEDFGGGKDFMVWRSMAMAALWTALSAALA
jgi:hypothetical protein